MFGSRDNTMRVREIFREFCGDENGKCDDLERNFEFMMELYVEKRLSSEELCDQAGLCGATGASGLFLSAEKYEDSKQRLMKRK